MIQQNTNFQMSISYFCSPDGDDDDYYDDEYEDDEEEKGPALEIYGTDITALARQGMLEECYGREKELLEMMEILVRRQKNNPVLVGDAGVGKTAIIELFANKIVNNLVPFVLEGRSIVSLDLARIVAGSRYRGEFELRFQRVLDEVLSQPEIGRAHV
jgi:ATP-dependent Clp protease ATP-binding subunit ClpA